MSEPTINPCPCCGGECRLAIADLDGFAVQASIRCDGCGYRSGPFDTKAEAIAAHNDLMSRAKLRALVECRRIPERKAGR